MSIYIFNESSPMSSNEYVKCFVVGNQRVENLADYVRRVRVKVKGFSLSEVERNSGGNIAGSYVSRIENGQVKNVTPGKLSALARGLQVLEEEVIAVATGRAFRESEAFDSEIYVAFKGFEELSDKDKAEMLATVQMLGSEIQRRRPKRPPDKDKAKGKK